MNYVNSSAKLTFANRYCLFKDFCPVIKPKRPFFHKEYMPVPNIHTRLYTYHLPDARIASVPFQKRDESKLLHYKRGKISSHSFFDLPTLLTKKYQLVFNNTRVIAARLKFHRASGAGIEIFLLEPELPSPVVALAMQQTKHCAWRCLVGNLKKWKPDEELVLETENVHVKAKLLQHGASPLVEFTWEPATMPFFEVVENIGFVPLPPYIKRQAEEEDKSNYQTVYASVEGAVAAPTAGLHFTEEVLSKLLENGHGRLETTLHVSAGTFLPLKAESASDHNMHVEQVSFTKDFIGQLASDNKEVIAVGTTSMRALESLYWFGVKLMQGQDQEFFIDKEFAYDQSTESLLPFSDVFAFINQWMQSRDLEELQGATQIFIVPGYEFKVCKGLITNFHQPDSTLLLLVAAFVGEDWKDIYDFALNNDFRFLSYGDSSLLFRN